MRRRKIIPSGRAANPVAPRKRPPRELRRQKPKLRRNVPCPCGSGEKYKKCCMVKVNPVTRAISELRRGLKG